MTYAQYGTVQATDYNDLIGADPGTTANKLNTVWATGGTNAGYGQTALANVTTGNTVTSSNWANLVNRTSNAASHQGSTITSVTAPASGGTITYLSAIPTNLTTIYTNRLNATTQGSTTANTATYPASWNQALTFTHTATFANGNAARYFFNSGGQLAMTVNHVTGNPGDLLFNQLASNVGTVVLSAPNSGSITIAGTTYNGITKIGGGGNAPTISQNNGYFALTTSNANVFTQLASSGPVAYLGSFIRFIVKSNGTQGSNGDAGSIITIYTIWDEVPDGYNISGGTNTTITVRPPSTTYLANTWGTISLSGSVTGS